MFAKVTRLLHGVRQLLVQGLRQEESSNAAQQKENAQDVVRCPDVHGGAQVDQVRGQDSDSVGQNGAQRHARLSHARGIDLQALQVHREKGERVEELDERGQVDHEVLVPLIRRIHNDGQAGDERDEEGYGVGEPPAVRIAWWKLEKWVRGQIDGDGLLQSAWRHAPQHSPI